MSSPSPYHWLGAFLLAAVSVLVLPVVSRAQGRAQFGPPGTGTLTLGISFVDADRFHRQGFVVDGPHEAKRSFQGTVDYVLVPDLLVSVSTSGGRFHAADGGSPSGGAEIHAGLQDLVAGLTWRIVGTPGDGSVFALRVGGSTPGPYDPGYTNSLGDGAPNLDVAGVVERSGDHWTWSTLFGYRWRGRSLVNPAGIGRPTAVYDPVDVPPEFFAAADAHVRLSRFSLGVHYQVVDSREGLDIGLPGWRSDRWPLLREDVQVLGLSVDLPITDRFAVSTFAGTTFAGRNTPAYRVLRLAFSVGFRRPQAGIRGGL